MPRVVEVTVARAIPAAPRIALGYTVFLASCAVGGDGSGGVDVVVRDSAGIAIVESRGAGWDSASAWRISAEPLLVIGARSGDPAEEMARVGGATRLSDGRIAVLETQTRELRYFDPDGTPLLTVGGQGGGPGEFGSTRFLVRLPADSLLVEDGQTLKQVVFGPDGELAREELFDPNALRALDGAYPCYHGYPFPDGSRVACVDEPSGSERVIAESGGSHIGFGLARTFERFVWIDATMTGSDTLGLYGGIEQFGVDMGRATPYYVAHALHARTVATARAAAPRFYVALNPAYSIEVWSPHALERIVRRAGARRVPDSELDERAWESEREMADRLQLSWNRIRDQVPEPDSIPAVMGLAADPDGYLFVQRMHWLEPGPRTYDVFDPEGRFLGPLVLPERFTILEIGRDYILGMRLDELDVPYVELWALERDGG